jgi:hypothetical protein
MFLMLKELKTKKAIQLIACQVRFQMDGSHQLKLNRVERKDDKKI